MRGFIETRGRQSGQRSGESVTSTATVTGDDAVEVLETVVTGGWDESVECSVVCSPRQPVLD